LLAGFSREEDPQPEELLSSKKLSDELINEVFSEARKAIGHETNELSSVKKRQPM
jgi:hypothetical protein